MKKTSRPGLLKRGAMVAISALGLIAAILLPATPAAAAGALTIYYPGLQTGVVGQCTSFGMVADGGTAPYYFYATANTLPPGITVDQFGTVSGCPSMAGDYRPEIVVVDAVPDTAAVSFGWHIDPPKPDNVLVPDLWYQSVSQATATLTAAGLVLGTITYFRNCDEVGVIDQSPTAGTPVALGTAVDVVVARIIPICYCPYASPSATTPKTGTVINTPKATAPKPDVIYCP